MKKSLIAMMLLVASLSFISIPVHRRTIGPARPFPLERNAGEPCECETGSSEEDFPYANHMDPAKYMEAYYQIRQMKSESEIEGMSRKGAQQVSGVTDWQSIGPMGVPDKSDPYGNQIFGRIRCMRWYYNTGAGGWERYLGAGSGGLWFGQSAFVLTIWQSLGDRLPNPSVGALAIDPTNPNVILAATGDWSRDYGAGVFKTTNRGASWTQVNGVYSIWMTEISYLLGNTTMIAAGWDGVYKSTDGGDNWNAKTIEPASPDASCYKLAIVNPARIYAALPKWGVYMSNDGGNTWTKRSNGLPARCGRTLAIDFSPSNSEILYAAYTDTNNNFGGIYRTTDGGLTWNRTATDPPAYIVGGQGHHVNVIRVHPDNSNTIYAGSVGFVKSTDGGSTWSTPATNHSDLTQIEFDPTDHNIMYVCSDGGIILRNDALNTITNSNYRFDPGAPLQVYDMEYAGSQSSKVICGTQDNGQILTGSASLPAGSWLQIAGCDGGNHLSIDPNDPDIFFGNGWCGSHSPRWRTLDGGATFDDIDSGLRDTAYIPIRLSKGGPSVLWTIAPGGLYFSYNRGNTWSPAAPSAGNYLPLTISWDLTDIPWLSTNSYASLSDKVCYIYVGGRVKIAEGTPGAMTIRDGPSYFNRMIADRGNRDEAFGLSNGAITRSNDRGNNWTDISGPSYGIDRIPGVRINDVVEIAGQKVLYAATDLGMFKTIDGGKKWFTFQTGLPMVAVKRIAYIPGLNYDTLRIATYGRGFWQRLINDVDPNSFASLPTNGIVLSMAGSNGVIFGSGKLGKGMKSTDGGTSWQTLETGTARNLNTVGVVSDQIAVAAGDTGIVIRTTDGGVHWLPMPVPTEGNIGGVTFTSSGTGFLVSDDGSLFKSSGMGENWLLEATFPGVQLASCDYLGDATGILLGHVSIGASGDAVYFQPHAGMPWTPILLPTAGRMHHAAMLSDSEVCVVGDGGTILKTTDTGGSWSFLSSGTSANLYDCHFTDNLTGWVCGDSGVVRKTEDGGQTWIDVSNGSPNNLRAVTFSGISLVLGGDGLILRSSQEHHITIYHDLHDKWNMVSLPVQASDPAVGAIFPGATSAAYAFNGGYVQSTSLAPGTGYWLKFNGDQALPLTGPPVSSLSIPVSPGWNLIGSIGTTIQTSDIQSLPAGMSTSQLYQYDGGYVVATAIQPGRAYWIKVDQSGTLFLTPPSLSMPRGMAKIRIIAGGGLPPPPPGLESSGLATLIPRQFALAQNYPNPFNPTTLIRYDIAKPSVVRLTVFDLLGREVTRLVNGRQDAGSYRAEWNASAVASGIYFYHIEAEPTDGSEKYSRTAKMILVK